MVHVVYLGAVSNGGSWERMHKTLPARATGIDLLVIASETKGWGKAPRGSDAKNHTSVPCKHTPLRNRLIYNSICWLRCEQTCVTIVYFKGFFFFIICQHSEKNCFTKAMISLVFSFSLFNFWQMITIFLLNCWLHHFSPESISSMVKICIMELLRTADYHIDFNELLIS